MTPLPQSEGVEVGVGTGAPPVGVACGFALQTAGYDCTVGPESASVHAALNDVTQLTQLTSAPRSLTGPPHAVPPGICTDGHVAEKPIVDGARSPLPPQMRSGPPQAWQILETALARARVSRFVAL